MTDDKTARRETRSKIRAPVSGAFRSRFGQSGLAGLRFSKLPEARNCETI
jgi:hypothetical protein